MPSFSHRVRPTERPSDRRTVRPCGRSAAFSLIEVMVATAVLTILVLMLGGVFQQASSSWDAGFVRAEGGMAVRAVVGSLARDLATAVDGRRFGLAAPVEVNHSTIRMARLKDGPGKGGRDVQIVKYTGGSTVRRTIEEGRAEDENESSDIYAPPSNAGANGAVFSFSEGPEAVYRRKYGPEEDALSDPDEIVWNVPSVKVRCKLTREGVFSGLTVRSRGRDGAEDTKDDIVVR